MNIEGKKIIINKTENKYPTGKKKIKQKVGSPKRNNKINKSPIEY